jgi:hypothetical protein
MSASNRLSKLEQRPQPQRPHGMTQAALALHMASLTPGEVDAFIKTMTDDDLSASIDHLKPTMEQQHAKP